MQRNYRATSPKACLVDAQEESFSLSSNTKTLRNTSGENILLLDLDNTLTDTRRWFADFILGATAELANAMQAPTSLINNLFAEVATATTLHEYGFAVEEIACRLKLHRSLSYKKIEEMSEHFWQSFAAAHHKIEVYQGVHDTLAQIRAQHKDLKIVVLTDSPEWVALERLSLTNLLPLVDGVVAIRTEDPKVRQRVYRDCIKSTRRRIDAAQEKVNKQHLLLNMSVPSACAKPSAGGIELIAKRLGVVSGQIIICGDKDTKEGLAAAQWRKKQQLHGHIDRPIHFVRANYGNHDLEHSRYLELASHIPSLAGSKGKDTPSVPVLSSLDRFDQLNDVLADTLASSSRRHAVA
ncbi:HAD hydrolase-like protein [bacterium]|nr:HAD hydrolase-like protein [bacterium]MBP9810534.1 HAD hydrolase-like protein [bacterium]